MKLNIGGGRKFKAPGWSVMDIHKSATFRYDFSSGELPFRDGLCDAVYCSHAIEHLTVDAGNTLICEAIRITKPGGFVRFTCPDFNLALRAYQARDKRWFETAWVPEFKEYSIHQCFLTVFASPLSEWSGGFLGEDWRTGIWSDEQVSSFTWSLNNARELCTFKKLSQGKHPTKSHHISAWGVKNFCDIDSRFESRRTSMCPAMTGPNFDQTIPQASLFVELQV